MPRRMSRERHTGCSRTVVRSDLVDKKEIVDGEFITIQCAYSDKVSYPLSLVELQVEGRPVTVEAAVSDTLHAVCSKNGMGTSMME